MATPPLIWNLLPQDIYIRNSMLISYVGFPSRFKSATLDSYDDSILFFTNKWRAYLRDECDMFLGLHWSNIIGIVEYKNTFNILLGWFIIITYFQVVQHDNGFN